MATIFLTSTGTHTWTVPNDWNDANNYVYCLGAGADGNTGGSSSSGVGGGGGAFAKTSNINLTPGANVSYTIAAVGAAYTTFFSTTIIKAVSASGKTGGSSASCVGDVTYSGGNGASAEFYGSFNVGGGGGGAAGPFGSGVTAPSVQDSSSLTGSGGAGDVGHGGDGADSPLRGGGTYVGSPGTEWGSSKGSGGGGSGGIHSPSTGGLPPPPESTSPGLAGGSYGAGGGGGGAKGNLANGGGGGNGTQGLIMIFYDPVPAPTVTSVSPNSGSIAGGTSVTITGTTFTGATSVTFGGTSATSVSVVNSTTITCVTPAHTVGLVTVAVTTPPGTGSLSNAYQYIAGKPIRYQFVGF